MQDARRSHRLAGLADEPLVNRVERDRGAGGMERVVLAHPSGSRAEVYLHGAHVTSWRTADGVERLFLSQAARFDGRSAIRGGIPVIFPQFADRGPLPKHGFARVAGWRLAGDEAGRDDRVILELQDSAVTREMWPHAFRAELAVSLTDDSLAVEIVVANRGDDPFTFTAALHSYLRVGDVERIAVGGLRGRTLESRAEGRQRDVERADELRIRGELDRVYFDVDGPVVVRDEATGAVVEALADGFPDVVLWNPGADKARALADFGADEQRVMLCVEAAVVGSPVSLATGERWRGEQRLRALR